MHAGRKQHDVPCVGGNERSCSRFGIAVGGSSGEVLFPWRDASVLSVARGSGKAQKRSTRAARKRKRAPLRSNAPAPAMRSHPHDHACPTVVPRLRRQTGWDRDDRILVGLARSCTSGRGVVVRSSPGTRSHLQYGMGSIRQAGRPTRAARARVQACVLLGGRTSPESHDCTGGEIAPAWRGGDG
jgi:hypothetical protein